MTMRLLLASSILLAFGFALFSVNIPSANAQDVGDQYEDILDQGLIFAGICESSTAKCDCRDKGECTLNDILQVVVNLTVLILAISGSAVLAMFVWGGFLWLTSGGNATRVEEGKKTMVGAVIGLVIIFGAYTAITFLINVLKEGEAPEQGETLEDVIGGDASDIIETSNE